MLNTMFPILETLIRLRKEAENVVAEIQDAVNHVASLPPNQDAVYSKVKSIVSHYKVFENTE